MTKEKKKIHSALFLGAALVLYYHCPPSGQMVTFLSCFPLQVSKSHHCKTVELCSTTFLCV